jgi:hypothetical protein
VPFEYYLSLGRLLSRLAARKPAFHTHKSSSLTSFFDRDNSTA